MTNPELVTTIVSMIIGSGGVAAAITALVSMKKYKAEARLIEQQAEAARLEAEQKTHEYIRTQLTELSETHKAESDELRKQNRELSEEIINLNNKVNQLMSWIVGDNLTYRSWLENELRKLKPDIKFPKCRPAPGFTNIVIDQAFGTPEMTDTNTNEEE
jgi:gas vesicle protein